MKKDLLTKAMETSISEVLETMFFSPLEFTPPADGEPEGQDGGPQLAARIGFGGPLTGYMRLSLSRELALSLTADFLGADPEDVDDRQLGEMVREMLNMFAGNTFSRFDSTAVFDLGIPEIAGPADSPPPPIPDENRISVLGRTLDGPVRCELILERNEWN